MQQKYIRPAKRLPRLPERGTIPEAERAEYDSLVQKVTASYAVGGMDHIPDSERSTLNNYSVFALSPPLGMAISQMGRAIMARMNKPGSFTDADHEMIDLVLPLDSGYYYLLARHTPTAIEHGIRIEAIEALRDHRDDLLTKEEYQQVEFIRAVRDGTMTDDIWERMKTRLGSERGVVEYAFFVMVLEFHLKFSWAAGVPEMPLDAFNRMLADYKSGARKVSAARSA